MVWPLVFAAVIVVVVVLKYTSLGERLSGGQRCPECYSRREPDSLLCAECGWIYGTPSDAWDVEQEENGLDYGELELPLPGEPDDEDPRG